MTPEDVQAIRAGATVAHPQTLLMCLDALEAAWAERDYERSLRLGKGGAMDAFHREYERAERAEAELFSVKAYAAELIDTLARVRTLCDGPNDCKSCSAYSNIRAAIEGDNQ